MYTSQYPEASVYRQVARYAVFMLSAALLIVMMTVPAIASGVSGSGNWIDLTTYCGSGVCVPISANHQTSVSISYYWVDSYHRVTYWEDFGGMAYPGYSLCGYHDWLKGSTYYQTSGGNVTIGGWYSTGAWCSSGAVCHNYHSDMDYWLTCSWCTGQFGSNTWFTNRCIPNMSWHTTSVGF